MATTLLGISGSLTKGGTTRTVVEYALRAARERYPEITTAILDLREVTLSFCDGLAPTPPGKSYGAATAQFVGKKKTVGRKKRMMAAPKKRKARFDDQNPYTSRAGSRA